jgi:hypothetical protein
MLRRAYKEFERQVESIEARPAKSDLVRQTVLAQLEQFTLGDLAAQLPSASTQLIKKVLAKLKKQGRFALLEGEGALDGKLFRNAYKPQFRKWLPA